MQFLVCGARKDIAVRPTSESPVSQSVQMIVTHGQRRSSLGQGLALPFQQTVTGLSTLQLAFHLTQRLPRGKDRLSLSKASEWVAGRPLQ